MDLGFKSGEDAESAVHNHHISNKLLSSIKQVLAGADKDEEQNRLQESEALNKLEDVVSDEGSIAGMSLQDLDSVQVCLYLKLSFHLCNVRSLRSILIHDERSSRAKYIRNTRGDDRVFGSH